MEIVVIIIIIVIILIIFIARLSGRNASIEQLAEKLSDLTIEIRSLRKQVDQLTKQAPGTVITPQSPAPSTPSAINEVIKNEPVIVHPQITTEEKQVVSIPVPPVQAKPIQPPPQPEYTEPKKSWYDTWLQNNPDIEKFIGENLINKIGIAVLVLGIAFFVKYAIDKDWINEVGRVVIGLLCGSLLVALAHRLRKNYRSFSSVLVGGGLTVFYFTIAFAFHEYQLVAQLPAFLIMALITAFAVILSILYNRIELAILAAIGGFITPFLVSTGSNNYVALFTYLGILNAGLIVLAYFKRWLAINVIAFFFTSLIFGGWLLRYAWNDQSVPYINGLLFATLFYVMFLIMQLASHIKNPQQFTRWDFSLLLAINAVYYGSGMMLLSYWNNGEWQGLFTAFLALLNCALGWFFYKQKKFDRNFVYLLIGLTLTFISLAAPVQLNGNYITLFWTFEAVLLLWFYQQTNIRLVKITSLLVAVLSVISLLMDWAQVYQSTTSILNILFNKACLTSIIVAAALLTLYRLLYKEADHYYVSKIPVSRVRNGYLCAGLIVLLIGGLLEIGHQFNSRFPDTGLHFIYLELYMSIFFAVMFAIMKRLNFQIGYKIRLGMPVLVFAVYLLNITNIYGAEQRLLTSGRHQEFFLGHWLSVTFMILLAAGTINYFRKNKDLLHRYEKAFAWISSVAMIVLLSVEIRNLFIWFNYSDAASVRYAENLYSKAGLSIVWALCSFTLIWLGMKFKFRPLRIIALVLFGATLVKLFTYDIRNIPPGGKIAAFILLGVVLLIVSFMYQRLKKILIDDTAEKS